MAVISGLTGEITFDGTNALTSIGSWSINRTVDTARNVMSSTGGGEVTTFGNADWTGSFNWFGKTPPTSSSNGAPGTAKTSFYGYNGDDRYTGSILLDSITHECPIEEGGPVRGSSTFGGNGVLSLSNAAAPTEVTTANLFPATAGFVEISTNISSPSYSAMAGVRGWSLRASRKLHPYAIASTVGKRRVVGPWSNVNFTISVYEGDSSAILTPGTNYIFRLYSSATEFWQVTYGALADDGVTVDMENGTPVGVTYNFHWTAYANVAGTMTKGTLITPGTETWYS